MKGSLRDYLSPNLLFIKQVLRHFGVYSVEYIHLISNSAFEQHGVPQANWIFQFLCCVCPHFCSLNCHGSCRSLLLEKNLDAPGHHYTLKRGKSPVYIGHGMQCHTRHCQYYQCWCQMRQRGCVPCLCNSRYINFGSLAPGSLIPTCWKRSPCHSYSLGILCPIQIPHKITR